MTICLDYVKMWLFCRSKTEYKYQGSCYFLIENKCFIFCKVPLIIKDRTEKELSISIYLRVVKWGAGQGNDHSLKLTRAIIIERCICI